MKGGTNKTDKAANLSGYGPGGRKCPCCGPGKDYRKQHDRTAKRRMRAMVRKEIDRQLRDQLEK